MYDDSKRAKRIVEDVTEGIAETSSIYVKGYSDSNVASLSVVKSGERQGVSNRLAFNDSNKTSEVYHIRASHDNPIDIGFDIRNAKVKKNGSDLELFLPGNRQVIICDYFRNLESLPNIVFAGTIILTGEEFLCVFAHTLYTWYREVKHRATVHIQHTMSDIVKTVKNIRKKISYQSTESDVTNSKFWNSLSVIDNTPVANEDMPIHTDIERIEGEISSIQESLHTMSEYCTQNTLELKDRIDKNTEYMSSVVEQMQGVEYHTVISKIYNEVGLLRNSIEQIQSMIGSFQGTTEHKRYRNESNNEIIPRLSLLEETVNNLVHTVESIHSIVHSIQNEAMLSKPCSHDLENILSEIASIKHTVHLLEQQLGNVHNRNTQEALSTTLRSYTELLQDELQTLRSYVDTVSNECKHTDILPTQDISRHLSEVESAIYRSLSKIKTMQGNIAGQKESIRTEAVPLYSELNGIKKNLEEFQVMVESIRSSIVKDTSSIGDNVDYIANELVSMSARLRQLNTYIDTVDTKIHSLFEVNEIGENKDNQGGVVHQGLEEEYNTLSKLPAEEEVYRVHEDSIPESNEEYIDALYTDENTVENQSDSISTGIEQEEYGEKTSLEYIVQQVQQDIHALSKIVQSLVDTNEKYQTQYSTMHDKIQNVYHEIHAIRTKMEQDNTESQYTINEEWSVEEKGDGGEDIHDALYDSVNESQEIHYTSNNTDENGNEVYLSQDEITGQNEDRSEEYLEENSSSLEQPKHEDVVSREQFEVLEGNVASLYDITQQIKDSLEELQSSIATMNSSDIHVVSTSSNAIPTSSFSIQSLQTWIQSIQGLPEEFTQAITVLSIEYNGSEKSVDTPFATTYGTAFISFSGEIHYTPNDTLAYQEGVVYTENFTCVLNNIEQLSLSLSFSLSISLVSSVLHVVISPVIQYVYLHDNHGLLIDIEIRNPAIGDVLYSTSARENMYKYKLSSEQHCIIQDIESIEESEEIAHNFHIRVNPNIQHQRYILVHIYGYIAGIQYNDSHIYTIEYKEGVLDYPILSSQKIAHFESIPQHSAEQESLATSENSDTQVVDAHFEEESPQEEVYKARGEENKIYDETPIDEVYQSDEYDVNTPLEDTEYSSEEGDEHTLFDGTHDEHDEYSDALAYEEHSPYQEEYYPSDDEYSYGTFEEENEEEESLFSQEQVEHSHEMPVDALHTTVFMKEAIAQYALQHTLTVDHCICNGIVYSVQEVWLSRYGMVCVYSDGSVSYALQPYVQTGLLYKTVYDVFTCVLYDEEGRQIDVEMAFELRPTQEGVVFSEVDVKTIPVEDMPALRTFTVKASLSHTAQTDYLLMIETYTQPYIYSQDIHSIYISFLSTMEAVEEFIKNVVVYIPSPETNLNSRSVSITIEGYHNGEYIANVEHFHVIPEQGKEYYYATDFMTHTNTNSEQLEEYLEHEQNIAESTSHEPSYEISEERKEHDDMYDDYARYDDYENGVEEEAEDIRNENESHLPVGSGDIDLKSESEDSAVNTIPRENVFTVEDALMCKRISSKDIRLSGITGDSVVLVGDGWNISNTPHKVYLQGCVYNTYGISSREGEYNVFIPEGVHVTYREQ